MEVANGVLAQLHTEGLPMVATVEDASKCNGKKVCLVDLGRRKQVTSMVLVEVAAVLGDGVGRVEAISIEEDGRSLGVVNHDGPVPGMAAALAPKLAATLLVPLRTLHGIKAPEPVVEKPVVVEPPPPPPPLITPPAPTAEVVKPVAAPVENSSSLSAGKIAGLVVGGAGVATLIGAGIEGVVSLTAAGKRSSLCPAAMPCTNPDAYTAYTASAQAQSVGVILAIAGGVATAAGVVIFLVSPSSSSAAPEPVQAFSLLPVVTPNGAALSLSGRF